MAIFGTTKTKKGSSSAKVAKGGRVHTARARRPVAGSEHDVIRAPWLSEKALIMTEKGVYAFAVTTRATKAEIAGAIKEIYKVSPRAIRIVNLPAKKKTMRTKRGVGVRAARRKAYVYLNKGDSIQFA